MKAILIERIKGLGDIGDVIQVKDGYARNFLFPQHKALPATEDNLISIEERRGLLEEKERQQHDDAVALAEKIAGASITDTCMAGDEGKLYGAVGVSRIVELLAEQGFHVTANQVVMPGEAIRQLGDYTISLSLHADISCDVTLHVVAQEA